MSKHQTHYITNTNENKGQVFCYRPETLRADLAARAAEVRRGNRVTAALACVLAIVIAFAVWAFARAEEPDARCWVLCKPGSQVNLRMDADKGSKAVGFLECGDSFTTDGTTRDGWVRVLDAGECECWIYSGYVVTEKPEAVFDNYLCVANKQVACRRWVNGPQIKGRLGWLHNGSTVTVFYVAGDWALTSRGYIRSEWLEADPV